MVFQYGNHSGLVPFGLKMQRAIKPILGGRDIRNAILKDIMPLLWHELKNRAITVLKQIEPAKIKNDEILARLIAYL